jgi:F-type H+-transporting ATPase subunit a
MTLMPGKLQNLVEMVIEGLDGFIKGVLGPEGGRYVPFLGTLFLYIYFQNVFGLVPMMFTPTSVLSTTAALAICVFLYVQFEGIRSNGIGGYLRHMAGDPKDPVAWAMAPLMFPLHVVGELAKPVSLSLRLFGNMMGEETLIAVFLGLGVSVLAFTHLPVGLPLHLPFMFLALLTTLIQATVFTLLSTIYFALVLPHHEHEHEEAHGGEVGHPAGGH